MGIWDPRKVKQWRCGGATNKRVVRGGGGVMIKWRSSMTIIFPSNFEHFNKNPWLWVLFKSSAQSQNLCYPNSTKSNTILSLIAPGQNQWFPKQRQVKTWAVPNSVKSKSVHTRWAKSKPGPSHTHIAKWYPEQRQVKIMAITSCAKSKHWTHLCLWLGG